MSHAGLSPLMASKLRCTWDAASWVRIPPKFAVEAEQPSASVYAALRPLANRRMRFYPLSTLWRLRPKAVVWSDVQTANNEGVLNAKMKKQLHSSREGNMAGL